MRRQQVMCAATLILVASLVSAGLAQAQSATQGGVPVGCRPFESVREIIPSPLFPHDNTLFAIVGTGDWPDMPVLRSADGGVTWTPIRLPGLIALDLSFSQAYATDQTLYVSLRGSAGNVLARSTDAGTTWTTVALPHTAVFGLALPLAVVNPQTLFLGKGGGVPGFDSEKGLFYSDDGGQTWTRRLAGGVLDIALSPDFAHDHTLFVGQGAYHFNGGASKSTDGGLTWQPSYAGLPFGQDGATYDFTLSADYAFDRTLFVVSWGVLYRSTDAGAQWTRLSPGPYTSGGVSHYVVSPRYPQDHTVWLRGDPEGRLVSHDGGATWQPFPFIPLSATEAYCPGGGDCGIVLFAQHYAADAHSYIYKSYDYGRTWQCLEDPTLPPAPSPPPAEVPEPATFLLLAGGLVGLAGYLRSRHRRRA